MSSLLSEEYLIREPRRGFANTLGETYSVGRLYSRGITLSRVDPAVALSASICSMRRGETMPANEEAVKAASRLTGRGFRFTMAYSGDKLVIRCDEPAVRS